MTARKLLLLPADQRAALMDGATVTARKAMELKYCPGCDGSNPEHYCTEDPKPPHQRGDVLAVGEEWFVMAGRPLMRRECINPEPSTTWQPSSTMPPDIPGALLVEVVSVEPVRDGDEWQWETKVRMVNDE